MNPSKTLSSFFRRGRQHETKPYRRRTEYLDLGTIPSAADDLGNETLSMQTHSMEISMDLVDEVIRQDKSIIILDVRSQSEYDNGHIPKAVNIPLDNLIEKAADYVPDLGSKLFVYSQNGSRCSRACRILSYMGYTDVTSIGSIMNWTGKLQATR